MGKYWLNNNLWGRDSGSGWQCMWDNYSGSTIGWGTSWGWSGQSNSVKSYTSTVLGWHWGWKTSGHELPVRLNAGRDIFTDWRYRVSGSGTMNVAYDLWLHNISNPDWQNNPTDEVMVWLYRSGGAGPLGTFQGTVNIAGTSWDLYRGNIGWNVFSFVRRSNTTSATLHMQDFLGNLISRGWVANTKYLSSIQAGTEVFIGNGQLDTDAYTADIR
jgi:xyloglucan-specific endo-beta-1,4-glucanase